MPAISSADQFQVLRDGKLFLPSSGVYLSLQGYCLEHCRPSNHTIAIICQPQQQPQESKSSSVTAAATTTTTGECHLDSRENLYTAGMVTSAAALGLTLLVYTVLPELRNAPGRNLLCLASALMMAYLLLIVIRLGGGSHAWPKWLCIGAGAGRRCRFAF